MKPNRISFSSPLNEVAKTSAKKVLKRDSVAYGDLVGWIEYLDGQPIDRLDPEILSEQTAQKYKNPGPSAIPISHCGSVDIQGWIRIYFLRSKRGYGVYFLLFECGKAEIATFCDDASSQRHLAEIQESLPDQ